MTTGKTIALIIWTFVSKVVSLLFNAFSWFIIAFPPKSKHLSIPWLQLPSTVILEPKKRKSVTTSTFSPFYFPCRMGPNAMIWVVEYKFGSEGKASAYNAGDLGSIPGSGRFPGEGNGNPLQYSCLENPMDGGAWCRPLSMGSQRVRHDWATSLHSCSKDPNSLKTFRGRFLKTRWERGGVVGCVISLWVCFWLVGDNVIGSQRHQPSGSSESRVCVLVGSMQLASSTWWRLWCPEVLDCA